jgi:SAM-dependent methyltransferase
VDPAQFYTGIVADLYAPLRSVTQDPEPYARFVDLSGTPALELGCGDGDPLLDLRLRGLDVEGVDASADMLERCRRRAAEHGVDVVVHHQRMETLDLPGRYRTIFLAGPTFNLLPDDDLAGRALRRIRHHLADDGSALIPLFIPQPTGHRGVVREATDARGAVIRVCAIDESRDEDMRVQTTVLRYEREVGVETTTVDRPWVLHWHTQDGFRELAATAGLTTVAVFDADGGSAGAADDAFAFWLRSAS